MRALNPFSNSSSEVSLYFHLQPGIAPLKAQALGLLVCLISLTVLIILRIGLIKLRKKASKRMEKKEMTDYFRRIEMFHNLEQESANQRGDSVAFKPSVLKDDPDYVEEDEFA